MFNLIMYLTTRKYIKKNINDKYDAVLVLGSSIINDKPGVVLKDRLDESIRLYKNGISSKIVVSGDHINKSYDEVIVMKNYLIENGVKEKDVISDHGGISTYDSIYRLKCLFNISNTIISTQRYHLYRCIYIAKKLNITCLGIPSKNVKYKGNLKRRVREIFARVKDMIKCTYKPKSKYTDLIWEE